MPDDQLENSHQDESNSQFNIDNATNQSASLTDMKTVSEPSIEINETKKTDKKFKKIILPITVLVLLLIGGSSAYGLVSWYQSPQNTITDSLMHALTAKKSIYIGTYSFEDATGENKVVIDLNTKAQENLVSIETNISIKSGTINVKAKGSSVVDSKGNLYVKAGGLADLVDEYASQLGIDDTNQLITSVNNFVSKIDNKWIKVSSDDLKEVSKDASSAQKCLTDTVKKYENDQAAIKQITDIYRKNQFIISEKDLGIDGNNRGFRINIDETKTKIFASEIQNTSIYKSLNKCDSDTFKINQSTIDQEINKINDSNSSNADSDEGYINLWIDNWSHNISKIEISSKSDSGKFTANIEPKYNIEASVSIPGDSISVSELKSYIEELVNSYASSYEY